MVKHNKRNLPNKVRCAKCGTTKNLTYHHILKRCVFGNNNDVIVLCKSCHNGESNRRRKTRKKNIEELIREMEHEILRQHKQDYIDLNERFLNGEFD